MGNAAAGHGATIAMELDPTSAQGTFTTIAELNGDIGWPGLSRPETDTTIHQEDIDSYVLGVLQRDPLTVSVNWIFDDNTHDHATGLVKAIIDNELRGFRVRGPGGSADSDEWIMSGRVQQVSRTDPVREGVRTSEVTIRMSGPMIIDGVTVGAAA